jgi:hypothetical protein
MTLFAIPMGQFQTFCRATSHTHSAPDTNPRISTMSTHAPLDLTYISRARYGAVPDQ